MLKAGTALIHVYYPGFSPHEVHSKSTFFGWILPTLRTSEFTVLQIVGLDAAVVSLPDPANRNTTNALTAAQLLQILLLLVRHMYDIGRSSACADQLSREWHNGRRASTFERCGRVIFRSLRKERDLSWLDPLPHISYVTARSGSCCAESLAFRPYFHLHLLIIGPISAIPHL